MDRFPQAIAAFEPEAESTADLLALIGKHGVIGRQIERQL
jgi:hypothetical protein